jgi:hypothetical protein
MMNERTIKSSALTEYLGIPYPTLSVWINIGLFGEKLQFPGRGSDRRFNFEDVCTARIIQEVLSLSPNFRIAREAANSFRGRGKDPLGNMIITVYIRNMKYVKLNGEDGVEIKRGEIFAVFGRRDKEEHSSKKMRPGAAELHIPIDEIMQEVREKFPDLVEG